MRLTLARGWLVSRRLAAILRYPMQTCILLTAVVLSTLLVYTLTAHVTHALIYHSSPRPVNQVLLKPEGIIRAESMMPPEVNINTAFCILCGKRPLLFKHYLSILSVIHNTQAQQIIIFLDHTPRVENNAYNTWLNDLEMTYPFLRHHFITQAICDSHTEPRWDFITSQFTSTDSFFYFDLSIVMVGPSKILQETDTIISSLNESGGVGFVFKPSGIPPKDIKCVKSGCGKPVLCNGALHYKNSMGIEI